MPQLAWDLWVDFAQVYNGLTLGDLESARDGSTVEPDRYIIVGDHDADSAVTQVVEVKPNGIVLLKVLPGHADTHAELLATRPA